MFSQRQAQLRLVQCKAYRQPRIAMHSTRRIVADFSFAAAAAALIGIAVGGAALSFVWLVAVLNR
jgi:hypothetical protein